LSVLDERVELGPLIFLFRLQYSLSFCIPKISFFSLSVKECQGSLKLSMMVFPPGLALLAILSCLHGSSVAAPSPMSGREGSYDDHALRHPAPPPQLRVMRSSERLAVGPSGTQSVRSGGESSAPLYDASTQLPATSCHYNMYALSSYPHHQVEDNRDTGRHGAVADSQYLYREVHRYGTNYHGGPAVESFNHILPRYYQQYLHDPSRQGTPISFEEFIASYLPPFVNVQNMHSGHHNPNKDGRLHATFQSTENDDTRSIYDNAKASADDRAHDYVINAAWHRLGQDARKDIIYTLYKNTGFAYALIEQECNSPLFKREMAPAILHGEEETVDSVVQRLFPDHRHLAKKPRWTSQLTREQSDFIIWGIAFGVTRSNGEIREYFNKINLSREVALSFRHGSSIDEWYRFANHIGLFARDPNDRSADTLGYKDHPWAVETNKMQRIAIVDKIKRHYDEEIDSRMVVKKLNATPNSYWLGLNILGASAKEMKELVAILKGVDTQ
jgi:hypothetical protein